MSAESREMEENFETIKGLFVNMTQAIMQNEKQQQKLEKDIKMLEDSNKLLHESNDRLLRVNEKQRTMLDTLDKYKDKINLLSTELDDVKKENIRLKDSINNRPQCVPQPCTVLDACSSDTLKIYNGLLQDKIVDLEKQLLDNQNTSCQQVSNTRIYDLLNQISKCNVRINTLHMENKSLKEQLSNFRNMHTQIIAEMQLNNISNANGGGLLESTSDESIHPMIIDQNDENELKPLQVNIIDSDADESTSP
ncbi:uncharacterized protein LOC112691646 isoform X1 [Sipha flava]|uniref:Uncharacterized protein LOC112691646 isoform X1 n=1 Tax=Sipha flava TaxID=143950 RepID=A0A2S2QC46_9HEMI|nr:uncharacterized protein LOC112691646 isoform X1 [Sipha flava]